MLNVENLSISVDGREIIRGVSLSIKDGTVMYLFGKNGEGKSTLLKGIVGYPGYKVKGKIIFDNEDITSIPMHERARRGLVLGFQIPPEFDTIRVEDLLLEVNIDPSSAVALNYVKTLELENLIKRPLNKGFSGGEKKRMETFITLMLRPKLALFDEPDSGVDIDSLKLVTKALEMYREENPTVSYFIVTHHGHLLSLLKGSVAMVIINGKIVCSNEPHKVYQTILKYGYERCIECLKTGKPER